MKKSELRKIIREEIKMFETSTSSDGYITSHDSDQKSGQEKLRKEVFESKVNTFIKIIDKYVNGEFPDELDNKTLMKRMQSDTKKIIKIIENWKKIR
jgi:hypothetical protein